MYKPTVLDIFCGAGGMSEGFIQAGFNVAFACDINKIAKLTYMHRHEQLGYETKFACINIERFAEKRYLNKFLEGKKIDVVCGGPPCQGFSLAGKRDQADPRNMLFKSYIRVIKNVQPKYFVMENVEGILSMQFDKFTGITKKVYENKTVPEILRSEFYELGYYVQFNVLQASDFGVPQNRRRVFFIGHKIRRYRGNKYKDLVAPPEFPKRTVERYVSVKEAIDDLSFLESGHKCNNYRINENLTQYQMDSINGRTPNANGKTIKSEELFNHEAARHSQGVIDRFSLMNEGENLSDIKLRLSKDLWEIHKTEKLRCQRIRSNYPSPTILTLPDDLIHYSNNRIMTVREHARLQSFDDSFVFLGKRTTGGDNRKKDLPQYTQVGNAVPPLLAKAVAIEILRAINLNIE